ncbi:hypothetical protein D3C86_1976490 [compost metagenome]
MNGREDHVILIEQRHTSLIAGRIRRIKRQFGEEPFARGVTRGDLFELQKVRLAGLRIFMDAFEMRLVPFARRADFRRPAFVFADGSQPFDEGRPV